MTRGRKKSHFGENFWERVDMQGGESKPCWIWQGSCSKDGHGQVTYLGRTYPAHRVAYELCHGKAPEGVVRHACNVRGCCNPFHLVTGSQADNMRDRLGTDTDPAAADAECREIIRDLLQAGVSIGRLSRTLGVNHKSITNIRDRVGLYKND